MPACALVRVDQSQKLPSPPPGLLAIRSSTIAAASAACEACSCALVRAGAPVLQQAGLLPDSDVYTALGAATLKQMLGICGSAWAAEAAAAAPAPRSALPALAAAPEAVARAVGACPALSPVQAGVCLLAAGSQLLINKIARQGRGPGPAAGGGASSGAAGEGGARGFPLPRGWAEVVATSNSTALRRARAAAGGGRWRPAGFGPGRWTTSRPVTWRAGCFCRQQDGAGPVCDPDTRIQYAGPCAASCQVGMLRRGPEAGRGGCVREGAEKLVRAGPCGGAAGAQQWRGGAFVLGSSHDTHLPLEGGSAPHACCH
jgi:hypothetical protein